MARTESNNPALTRIPQFQAPSGAPGRGTPPSAGGIDYTRDPIAAAYNGPTATSRDTGRMTIEDVVVRTAVMLAVVVGVGAVTWTAGLENWAFPAALAGFGLSLFIIFKQVTSPVANLAYAALEGVFLGGISKLIGQGREQIVVQAVIGTVAVAAGMLVLYRSGRIRVTPQFTKMLIGATIGFVALLLVNLVASFITPGGLGLRNGGPLAIIVSIVAIGLASLNLVLDFDFIDKAVKRGVPERYGWLAAFGLTVTLVWLYVELLRLLSYANGRK